MLKGLIKQELSSAAEPLENIVVDKSGLMGYKDALKELHFPSSLNKVEQAKKRLIFNDVLYFSMKMKNVPSAGRANSMFTISVSEQTKKFILKLPEITGISDFSLTKDQLAAVNAIASDMKKGLRANYLIQGDVSCGKTIIAVISMFLMAENGYQSVIMVPTTILAKQHYIELKNYADIFGYKTALLSSELKQRQKKDILKGIENHEYDFIVGTHSVISESVKYCNLGLVVTDEEHRFGVAQREKLIKKAASGAHTITMSATPIPRTIADVMFGEDKKVCTINQMPSRRLPVQTAINHSTKTIFEFIKRQLSLQHQAYIVCPLIHEEDTEDETAVSDSELSNVQATFSLYKEEFEPLGYQVGMVNGKMDKDEIFQIINDFRENKIQILVSTTVIEVGVNVPNANVIVVNNAERFGLAQLHQLRGRVGRGSIKSYCILNSNEKDNPRLKILLDSANGFDVAKEDSKLRGYGDLLGTKQSGNNRYISLILRMPHLYEKIKLYASWMNQTHMGGALLSLYEEGEINETI